MAENTAPLTAAPRFWLRHRTDPDVEVHTPTKSLYPGRACPHHSSRQDAELHYMRHPCCNLCSNDGTCSSAAARGVSFRGSVVCVAYNNRVSALSCACLVYSICVSKSEGVESTPTRRILAHLYYYSALRPQGRSWAGVQWGGNANYQKFAGTSLLHCLFPAGLEVNSATL